MQQLFSSYVPIAEQLGQPSRRRSDAVQSVTKGDATIADESQKGAANSRANMLQTESLNSMIKAGGNQNA